MSAVLRVEEPSAGIVEITLDRPDAANAIDMQVARELSDVARRCESDATVRAVILTGAGARFFSAGGDVRSFATAGDALPALLRELTLYLHAAMSGFARMNAPLVTAVNGVAAGAGLSLAAASDICIAASSARFRSAYTSIGLSPDGSSTFWLPRLVGMRRAQEMFLTNVTLDAERALAWGLVTEVVPDAELLPRARAVAASFAGMSTEALGASRRLLLATFAADHAEQLENEARSIVALARTESARSAITSFASRGR